MGSPGRGLKVIWALILTLSLSVTALSKYAIAAQLQLTWTDNSDNEEGFSIERKTGTTGTFAAIAAVGPNANSYLDSGLADGTMYCYRVTAFNASGYSPYSNEDCATTVSTNTNRPPDGIIDSPAGNLTVTAGQSVNFLGTGTDPDGDLALSYQWNFGGGAPNSSLKDPGAVTFSTPGVYTVTFTVTDSLGLAGPTPATRTITVNPAPAGTLQFSSSSFSVNEGGGHATITITRTGGSNGAVGVTFTTSNGTATVGSDYKSVTQTVSFANGDTVNKTVSVPITEDAIFEGDETVNLTLSNPTGEATLGSPGTAVLTIVDNEPMPSISINDVTVTEGNSGTVNAVFTVTLSPASSQTVTVSYSTANGTATGGAICTGSTDYKTTSGTLTFTPGQTSQPITVQVCGDTVPEPDETFLVNLTSANGATIATGQGMGTIIDDDTLPKTINVSCPGDSLQAAVNAAQPGTTISIFGTCNENVLVDNNKMEVFIIGDGVSSTINDGSYDPANPTNSGARFGPETLDVRGKAILIQGLIITGGRTGILVHSSANAVINHNIVENAAEAGIAVEENAFAVITNNTVQSNGGDGIRVSTNSGANIGFNNDWDTSPGPNIIQGNGGGGIHIEKSSHANIAGNLIINNHDDGVAVLRISHADIEGNEIHGNGGDAVLVSGNSEADLGNNSSPIAFFNAVNTTTGTNAGAGIQCDESSVVRGHQGTLTGAGGAQNFSASCVTTNLVNP